MHGLLGTVHMYVFASMQGSTAYLQIHTWTVPRAHVLMLVYIRDESKVATHSDAYHPSQCYTSNNFALAALLPTIN